MENPTGYPPQRHRPAHHTPDQPSALVRFAHEYGWWRVVAIPVMVVLTIWLIVDIATTPRGEESSQEAQGQDTGAPTSTEAPLGPDPAQASAVAQAKDELPMGGEFTEQGKKTYRDAGPAGAHVGKGGEKTVRYSVEIEDGIDTSAYGGDAAVATLVDATLADPRGWTAQGEFEFIHVKASEEPDTRIRLTSLGTTAELCGVSLETETSCHTTITGESVTVLNESRWVRGAVPFEGDVGNYRQYLINHEFGHAIGYAAHQSCGGQGKLAPVMMQQTLSLNNAELHAKEPEEVYPEEDVTCEPNPWPYPTPASRDPHNPEAVG
ncbi:DUF3152 domain-containing protein [Corynebacterium sp.]|uniref:DUF3152 domain-containing protein n=1 Tax=Corynebacterium sp. TaxID=1720 RepID=UPI0026DB6F28|nr:DUF3152 domain-containing protein [Corynebacterium sp.]MDO5032086.1 DUF3152 domain-containing protein [Corynebacterium sp.]